MPCRPSAPAALRPSPVLPALPALLAAAAALAGPAAAQSNARPVPLARQLGRAVPASFAPAAADDALAERLAAPAPTAAEPGWVVEMELEGRARPSAELQGVGGELSVVSGGWDARLTQTREDRSLSLLVGADAWFYDWSPDGTLVAGSGDPFNDLYETRVGAIATFADDEAVGWVVGAEATLSGEDSADLGEAVALGALAGARCRAGEDLVLTFGLAAQTRLEDDAWVLPWLGFDWRLSDRVRLATEGARVELSAALSDALTASVDAEYAIDQFRLNDDGPLPGGVFQDDRITASAGLAWRPSERTTLELRGGAVLWQESTFLDEGGAKLDEVETEPGAFAALALRYGP